MAIRVRERRWPGFTLPELLVVMALICLLLSVLLPSMSRTREQAAAVVCLSNLRNLAQAGASYQTEHRGFIAGSPMTSGFPLLVKDLGNAGQWKAGMALNIFDFAVPLLQQMQIPLPKQMDAETEDSLVRKYYPLTTSNVFHCPTNKQVAVSWPFNNGVVIEAPSYLTMNTLMRGGPDTYAFWRMPENKARLNKSTVKSPSGATYIEAAEYKDVGQSDTWDILVPRNYVPRIDRIGNMGIKVFLADGLRFFKPPNTIDYNIHTTGFAGDMSAQPPSDIKATSNGAREYNLARKYSYRHGGGTTINAAFFDGHAEPLRTKFTTFHWMGYAIRAEGTALHPKHYFPSRSIVMENDNLFLQASILKGTVLP